MITRFAVHGLFAGTALALLSSAVLAQAPGSPAPGAAATDAPSPPSTPPAATAAATAPTVPPATAQSDQTADIVVTATRQEQVLSHVPISVAAYTQQAMDLKGVKTLADVARFTPGVQFDSGSNQVAIRGIASNAGASTTGIYIDDTPIQIRNLGFDSDDTLPAIFDLDRVEILRGPQGTLFGAGSEGGTVRYITPQPSLTRYSEYVRSEISTTAHGGFSWEAGMALGGPIVEDVLGFRISAWHRKDAGWIDKSDAQGNITAHNTNHDEVTVVRGALTWAPATNFTITPSFHYQQRTVADDDYYVAGISDPSAGVFKDSSPEYRRNPDHFWLPTLKLDWHAYGMEFINNLSYFTRHNISGYDGTVYDLSYYQDLPIKPLCARDDCATPGPFLLPNGVTPGAAFYLSPSVVTNDQRILTEEARLQSANPNAPITWVAGVFYQHQRQLSSEELRDPLGNQLFLKYFGRTLEEYFGRAAGNGGPLPLYNGIDSYINQSVSHEDQIAGFADVTWHITPKLSITGGARVEKVTYSFQNFADGPQNYGRTEATGSTAEHPVTPKANISWQATPDDLFYFTYAKGFRPGGANAPVPYAACSDDFNALGVNGAPSSYKSDSVNSYEVGAKNRLFDRHLSLAASVFQIDWSGIQQFVYLPECAIMYIDNLGKARARGFDLAITATPFRGITIDAAVGYTDAKYTQTASYTSPTSILAVKGDSLGGAPWTASIGVQYDFALFEHTFFARGDYQFESAERTIPTRDPRTENYDPGLVAPDATHFVGLRAGATLGFAEVSIFVDNLLDSAPLLDRTHSGTDTLLFTDRTWRPRTVGLTVSMKN